MSDVNLSKLQKLFQEKRYSEVVLDIESSTTENNRSSALHNLLGVCRASQKGRTDRDTKYALNDFEKAFYIDNLGEISLESLCNHIKLCAEIGRKDSDLLNNMITSQKMYLEAEKKFSENNTYLSHGIDLYKYLIKHKEKISLLEKILKSNGLNKLFGSLYITSQMFLSNWKQKDFAEFQKKFSSIFRVLNSKKLSKIDMTKNIILDFIKILTMDAIIIPMRPIIKKDPNFVRSLLVV